MLSIFMKEDTSEYMPIILDQHTTSPGQTDDEDSAIVRNSPRPVIEVRQTEIYTRARQLYTRARRASMVHGSAIV
jgi:hypothetical protein